MTPLAAPPPGLDDTVRNKLGQSETPLRLSEVLKGLPKQPKTKPADLKARVEAALEEDVRQGRVFCHLSGKKEEKRFWSRDEKHFLRERALELAELVKAVDGMTRVLRSIGTPDDGIALSLERNDPAALSAAFAGAAEWRPEADDIDAPSLWYRGSDDDGGFWVEDVELATRLGVEIRVLPGADHVMSFRRADEVLSFVRPFLEQHRP